MSHRPLVKHTIVIWADGGDDARTIEQMARAAESGDCYCSKHLIEHLINPQDDPDWDGTEFFGGEDDGIPEWDDSPPQVWKDRPDNV